MNAQEIIVLILVLGAVAYIVQRTYNSLHKKECAKGCGCADTSLSKAKTK